MGWDGVGPGQQGISVLYRASRLFPPALPKHKQTFRVGKKNRAAENPCEPKTKKEYIVVWSEREGEGGRGGEGGDEHEHQNEVLFGWPWWGKRTPRYVWTGPGLFR